MDRKRTRTIPNTAGEKRVKLQGSEISESCEDRLRSNHAEVVLGALTLCKLKLLSKAAVETFVSSNAEQFFAVLDAFKRAALSEVPNGSPWSAVLKKASSILATCCFFSFSACTELAKPRRNIPQTLGRLLEMSEARVPLPIKASLLRLIKNLCQHKEIAASMTYFTLDSIVQYLTNEDRNVGYNALGIVRALVNQSLASRVVAANGCKHIGDLLAREEELPAQQSWSSQIFAIFRRLAPSSASTARTIGRQLAMSKGGEALLSMFLKKDCDEEFSDMVVKICTHSFHIREYFCDHGILEKIVSMDEPPISMISVLCAYTKAMIANDNCDFTAPLNVREFVKDAWSRERLLNGGALDVMLNRFCVSSQSSERFMIISSLMHFFHYVIGLVHIFRNTAFLETIVADISQYLGEPHCKCKHNYDANNLLPCTMAAMDQRAALKLLNYSTANKDRMNSSFYGRLYTKQTKSNGTYGGSCSPVCSWSRSISPPSNSLGSWCVPVSPPSAGSMSPPSIISPSSSVEDFFSPLFVDDNEDGVESEKMEVEEDKKEPFEADHEERSLMQKIVSAELQLFSYPTSENNILGILIREDIVDVLLRCCSEVTLSDAVPVKILLRMVEYRTMMDKLLAMQFHSRIFHTLMTKKWNMEGHERALSSHCTTCTTLGYLLLKEFSSHVDSNYGLPILVDSLKAKAIEERMKASVAALYLVRSQTGQIRVYSKYNPINLLVEVLCDIFSGSCSEEKILALAYDNGPSMLYQILCTLSAIVDSGRICSLYRFKNEAYNFIMIGGDCAIHRGNCVENGEYVVFKTESGKELEKISKERLIASSDYFKSMFGSEFLEKTSGCGTFLFSEEVEDCTEDEFKQFLHYLCGCRSEKCFRLDSAHPVVVMIKLSDRYLCTSMTDMLLAENGPAIYYMLKGNVEEFLSPLLFTGIGECECFEDAFFFQLLRFSTDDEVRSTLWPLSANLTATEVFIGKLNKFLRRHIISDIYVSAK